MNANLSWGNNFSVLSASIPLSAINAAYSWKSSSIKKNYHLYEKFKNKSSKCQNCYDSFYLYLKKSWSELIIYEWHFF